MATAEGVTPHSDWPLSNPWPWLLAGVAALAAGFLWMRLLGPDDLPVRGLLLLLVLLAVSRPTLHGLIGRYDLRARDFR